MLGYYCSHDLLGVESPVAEGERKFLIDVGSNWVEKDEQVHEGGGWRDRDRTCWILALVGRSWGRHDRDVGGHIAPVDRRAPPASHNTCNFGVF